MLTPHPSLRLAPYHLPKPMVLEWKVQATVQLVCSPRHRGRPFGEKPLSEKQVTPKAPPAIISDPHLSTPQADMWAMSQGSSQVSQATETDPEV